MAKRRGELEIGDVLGQYRLADVLGEGQMGVVYRAVRENDGTTVALKVLRSELSDDPVYRRRFVREEQVARLLDHRHLVRIVDAGEAGGRHFLATEYIRGDSLAARIDRDGPLDGRAIVRVVAHIGSALDEMHRHGLVHRDVKPANVMLDDADRASLTDFGLARGQAHTVLTKLGRVVGTVDYLAPEVIRGERARPPSDLYALGCIAYECAAGHPPFASASVAQTCIAHVRDEPPDLQSRRPDLRSGFRTALLKALAKDPASRPATGAAYARLLSASARPS